MIRRWVFRIDYHPRMPGFGIHFFFGPPCGRLKGDRTLYVEFGVFTLVAGFQVRHRHP